MLTYLSIIYSAVKCTSELAQLTNRRAGSAEKKIEEAQQEGKVQQMQPSPEELFSGCLFVREEQQQHP